MIPRLLVLTRAYFTATAALYCVIRVVDALLGISPVKLCSLKFLNCMLQMGKYYSFGSQGRFARWAASLSFVLLSGGSS